MALRYAKGLFYYGIMRIIIMALRYAKVPFSYGLEESLLWLYFMQRDYFLMG